MWYSKGNYFGSLGGSSLRIWLVIDIFLTFAFVITYVR